MMSLTLYDFTTSCILMPIVAILTCVFVGWVLPKRTLTDEVEAEGHPFKAKRLFLFLVRYIAPAFVSAILISEICRNLGIGGWKI